MNTPSLDWPASVLNTRQPTDDGRMPHPGRPPVPSTSEAHGSDIVDLMKQFTGACEAIGGQVHHCARADEVVSLVAELCGPADAPTAITWAATELPLHGVHEALAARGIDLLSDQVRTDHEGHAEDLARLARAEVGVTGAIAVLADTGSIVVTSGAGRPRLASLLPPVHVALVTRAQMRPSLPAWLTDNAMVPAEVANCVVITGPSRTADIEMTLTRGVHGPKAIHVVFVG